MPLFHHEDGGAHAAGTAGALHETSMRGNKELLMGAEEAATTNKTGTLRETLIIYKKAVF